MLKEIEDLAKEVHKVLVERDHGTLAGKLKDVCSALGVNLTAELCLCGHERKAHCSCGECCLEDSIGPISSNNVGRCYCAGFLLK